MTTETTTELTDEKQAQEEEVIEMLTRIATYPLSPETKRAVECVRDLSVSNLAQDDGSSPEQFVDALARCEELLKPLALKMKNKTMNHAEFLAWSCLMVATNACYTGGYEGVKRYTPQCDSWAAAITEDPSTATKAAIAS